MNQFDLQLPTATTRCAVRGVRMRGAIILSGFLRTRTSQVGVPPRFEFTSVYERLRLGEWMLMSSPRSVKRRIVPEPLVRLEPRLLPSRPRLPLPWLQHLLWPWPLPWLSPQPADHPHLSL